MATARTAGQLGGRIAALGAAPVLVGLGVALCGVQVRLARRQPRPYEVAHHVDGLLGPAGAPIRIAWLGDSLAAGLGVDHADDTPARMVARLLERPVELTVLATPGARAADVAEQQLAKLDPATDLVILSVGANDVASARSRQHYATVLGAILQATAPTPTLMLSLPDMATPDRMAQPLRSVAGARGRWFEAARARVAAGHDHVHSIDVASPPMGMTRQDVRSLLSADRFHPGAGGYRYWAERIADAAHELLARTPTTVAA